MIWDLMCISNKTIKKFFICVKHISFVIFFNIRDCFDKKKVSKSQLEELISFMEKWRECFDTNDFSSITGYPLWYDYGNNEEYIKELLDVFIPRFKELLSNYRKSLIVTADW